MTGGTDKPTISIVINTLNRAESLDATIRSFQWLRYEGAFEVVVVNGPSTDHSEEVIQRWGSRIRAASCPIANLSASRNIGICVARGDIVAFIDDDAIPEPEWLEQMAAAYEDPIVGAVGGLVFDHTGYEFQAEYCVADRLARAENTSAGPSPHLSYPHALRFPHLLGANSSFRRSALLEIDGFDEEFEYFLDETDVCARIVDAGYLIVQLPNAYVHHKFAPSNIRGHNKIPRYRYPIMKNKIYFMFKHARRFYPLDAIAAEQAKFVRDHREHMQWAMGEGLIAREDLDGFERDVERAIEVGWQRGHEGPKPDGVINEVKRNAWPGSFSAFPALQDRDHCTLVLISRGYPPDHSHGIATFTRNLAEAYAARGNIVHVIAQSPDINRVDFENGVWVHRMVPQNFRRFPNLSAAELPDDLWNWSATARAEVERIATHRRIDVVEAPIWDCEGAAFLADRRWPLVTSLHTTLHFWLDSHPEMRQNPDWMAAHGTPVLAMERRLMQESDGIRANSQAICNEIESAYGIRFDAAGTIVVPHGLGPAPASTPVAHDASAVNILFVGRLESRKGIDVLLDAIPIVLSQESQAVFRIIGDKNLPGPNGTTYAEAFQQSAQGKRWQAQVRFEGHVPNAALEAAYAECDIFVAPSRFESFGLVFLEAMRVGKPVIGCSAGGMPEVIADGECGLLVPPGDAQGLAEALLRLIRSSALRAQFGHAARERFEARFSVDRMASQSNDVYRIARAAHATRRPPSP